MNEYLQDITVCLKTFLRDPKTRDCFESWQKQYPGIKFIIIDDGYESSEQDDFYDKIRKEGHVVVRTEFDIGLSAGRNRAIALAKTKYVLMVDNDHFAIPETNLESMWKILEHRGDISIVGGKIVEKFPGGDEYPRWDGFMDIDTTLGGQRVLRYELLNNDRCTWLEVDDVKFTFVDITHNFLLVRKSIYPFLSWNEDIKICGEHSDFFLTAKGQSYKTVLCPGAVVWHNYQGDGYHPDYDKFRGRAWFLNIFAKKWNLDFSVNFWKQNHVYEWRKDA